MSAGPAPTVFPADRLAGVSLAGGWHVDERRLIASGTGGNFSTGYIVTSATGQKAFLKAMDYSWAFEEPAEIASRLQVITESINHERVLLERCGQKRLSRVVTSIASGTYLPDGSPKYEAVEYLIFELADGDIRRQLDAIQTIECAWKLRALHNIAVGLTQLHGTNIAHQDVKPSNVLVFGANDGLKIADLGRASQLNLPSPHESYQIAGDPSYASPESLYGEIPTDWNTRRFGCDAYLLGSMVVYFFTRTCMTEFLLSYVDRQFRPGVWTGSYDAVSPYLNDAFGECLKDFGNEVPRFAREDLVSVVSTLCTPDYRRRGDLRARPGSRNRFALSRYVSLFDRLTRNALTLGE